MDPISDEQIDKTLEESDVFSRQSVMPFQAEALLTELAKLFVRSPAGGLSSALPTDENPAQHEMLPSMEARYRVLLEQIPAVVFMALLDGEVSEAYVSPQIEQMLGFSREEWLDDPIRWYQQIHPEDRERWSMDAADMFLSGKNLKSVYRVIARDGKTVWFHCEAKLVRRKDGQPWFIHGVGFDVSDLKRTELALQRESAERERLQRRELEQQIAKTEQTESRLAAIVECSDDAIISKTLEGIVTSWNAAATRILGYEPEEMIGKSVLMLIPPELHQEEMGILRRLRAGERIDHYETERIAKNGDRIDVSLTISPIKDGSGRVVGASKIMRNITERRRMEQALRESERYAAMGRVAAVLAHEISNPLEAVTNTFYLLQKHPSLDGDARELARVANLEMSRVNHITKQTLSLYRQAKNPSVLSLKALLDEILEIYRRQMQQFHITVDKRLDIDVEILGFPIEIRQVFVNLISNAIQAMPHGGKLRVHLFSAQSRTPLGFRQGVRINVIDTGAGIRAQDRDRLFEPFFTTKAEKGTGLGLWVSRGIIEKMEGTIKPRTLALTARTVTCFSVFLPNNTIEKEQADSPVSAPRATKAAD